MRIIGNYFIYNGLLNIFLINNVEMYVKANIGKSCVEEIEFPMK